MKPENVKLLAEIQAEFHCPKARTNKFGGYSYRSAEDLLDAAKKVCNPKGCAVLCDDFVEFIEGRFYIRSVATIMFPDGETVNRTACAREPESKKGMDDSQISGTSSSYARKYALNALFAADDVKDADTEEFAKATKPRPKRAPAVEQDVDFE